MLRPLDGWLFDPDQILPTCVRRMDQLQACRLTQDELLGGMWTSGGDVIYFRPGNQEAVAVDRFGGASAGGACAVVAPAGQIFKRLKVFATGISGGPGKLTFSLRSGYLTDARGQVLSSEAAATGGALFDDLPRTGILSLSVTTAGEDANGAAAPGTKDSRGQKSKPRFSGLRAEAEFETPGPCGAVNIVSHTKQNFTVEIDGRVGRRGPGLVGLLPVGDHQLSLVCDVKNEPPEVWRTKVTVKAGETVEVVGGLARAEGAVWPGWSEPILVGRNYPPHLNLAGLANTAAPTVLAEDDRITMVWAHADDLWLAESRDGETFTAPQLIDMPVSTAWHESNPKLLKDLSGRYMLFFYGDRNNRGAMAVYLCWSRDLRHWSAPALLEELDSFILDYNFLQDRDGRYLAVGHINESFLVWASPDALRWQQVARVKKPQRAVSRHEILQREDGRFELLLEQSSMPNTPAAFCFGRRLYCYTSPDAITWSEPCAIGTGRPRSALRIAGRTEIIGLGHGSASLLQEQTDGRWLQAGGPATAHGEGTAAWHPKWGYIFAWIRPRDSMPDQLCQSGPFVARGPNLGSLVEHLQAPAGTAAVPVPPPAPKTRKYVWGCANISFHEELPTEFEAFPPSRQPASVPPPTETAIGDQNAFLRLVMKNDLAAVRLALKAHPDWSNARGPLGLTPLYIAARRGLSSMATALLEAGATVDATVDGGWTALHAALGRQEMVTLLVQHGANVKVQSSSGYTLLHLAATVASRETVEYLIAKGADPLARTQSGLTVLHEACGWNNPGVVDLIMTYRPDVNAREAVAGFTPLLRAAWSGQADVISLLLDKGAKLDVRSKAGDTPLWMAAHCGSPKAFQLLIDKGFDVNLHGSQDQRTPLHCLARFGYTAGVEQLLSHGADPNARDVQGRTALHEAAALDYADICKLLLDKEADVNARSGSGRTPLFGALNHETMEVVEMLVAHGADVNVRGDDGHTPLALALLLENKAAIASLKAHGAKDTAPPSTGTAAPSPSGN